MRCVNVADVEWFGEAGVRGPGADFKRLLNGPDLSPNNFEFNLVRVSTSYRTPRHRHNFDQVRFVVSGSFGFDKGREQTAGTVGYFPEGCYYQQQAEGPSETLLLQTSGASGAPYVSFPTLRRLVGEMSKTGEFSNGVYTTRKPDGTKVNKDAYEAIWETACGQQVKYSRPRYSEPILMYPEAFSYREVPGEPGVARKLLGRFGERELEIGFLRLEPGATHVADTARTGDMLFYTLAGSGRAGEREWREGDAMHLAGDDRVEFTASTATEFYYLRLPERLPERA